MKLGLYAWLFSIRLRSLSNSQIVENSVKPFINQSDCYSRAQLVYEIDFKIFLRYSVRTVKKHMETLTCTENKEKYTEELGDAIRIIFVGFRSIHFREVRNKSQIDSPEKGGSWM